MTGYTIALVTSPLWAAGMAYGVARGLQCLARLAADRLTRRGVR